MKRFVAQFLEGTHLNIPADRMEWKDEYITVYRNGELVAILDIGGVMSAYISGGEG